MFADASAGSSSAALIVSRLRAATLCGTVITPPPSSRYCISTVAVLRARIRDQDERVEERAGRAFREEPARGRRRDARAFVTGRERLFRPAEIHRALHHERHAVGRADARRHVGLREARLRVDRNGEAAAARHRVGLHDRRLRRRQQIGDLDVRRACRPDSESDRTDRRSRASRPPPDTTSSPSASECRVRRGCRSRCCPTSSCDRRPPARPLRSAWRTLRSPCSAPYRRRWSRAMWAPTFVKSGTTEPSCRWKRVSTFAGVPVGFAIASRVSKNVPVAPSAR